MTKRFLFLPCLLLSCSDAVDLSKRPKTDSGLGDFNISVPLEDTGPGVLDAGPNYAVFGLQPSHGPYVGGTRVEIRGRGFSSKTTVKIGSSTVSPENVSVSDPFHIQIIAPPGEVGPADVVVIDQTDGKKATLKGGFTYDSFYATPSSGATSGGTHIDIKGRETTWTSNTRVSIDGKDCVDIVVKSASLIECVTPKGTPGSKQITIIDAQNVVTTVRDAFTYADTSDGYRGGLSGLPLPGPFRVVALVNGDFVPNATVTVRGVSGKTVTQITDVSGVTEFTSPPDGPLTVTVAKKCLQPMTFAGVNVRQVTAYLDPVLSIGCVPPDGQPPPGGGSFGKYGGRIQGELVWEGGTEFKRGPWTGVPLARSTTQRAAAYVFQPAYAANGSFYLPPPNVAVTPETPGTIGYSFQLDTLPGNTSLYAIAGIEDRPSVGPAKFYPFGFGIIRGVAVPINGIVERVMIKMVGRFTHQAQMQLVNPPFSMRGPDRAKSYFSVDLNDGYMILPNGQRDDLLPMNGLLTFTGVPPLTGPLTTASYVASVDTVTGGSGGTPSSGVLRVRTRNLSAPVQVGPFVPIPRVLSPGSAANWDGQSVRIDMPQGAADLLIVSIGSSDELTTWSVVAPGDAREITLPAFSQASEMGIPPGVLNISVWAAKLDNFNYQQLRYGNLNRNGWSAYAQDALFGSYSP